VKRTAPLKVALMTNLYPPYVVGGYEILAEEVVRALRGRGHTLHVLTGRGRDLPRDGFTHPVFDLDLDRKDEVFGGALQPSLARALRWHVFHPPTYGAVRRKLLELEPELVVAWNLYGTSLAPLIAARGIGATRLAQPADKWLLHGLVDPAAAGASQCRHGGLGLRALTRALRPVLTRLASPDRLIAISEFLRQLHIRSGFPPSRTATLHLGVDVERFQARRGACPPGRHWRLAFAGQLWEGKGPLVAVEALARLRQRARVTLPDLEIFGAGTPGFEAHMRRRIEALGLATAVRLNGFVPRSRLGDALGSCHAFLFCSTWDEPFSRGLLEAMACGLPTVATTTGGTPEAVEHERNGLLVAPNDPGALAVAVERLILDPGLAARLGETAAADVRRRWSFDGYIDNLESAWDAARRSSSPRPAPAKPQAHGAGSEPADLEMEDQAD
jgi:glycosyltransferase involved in cell wall biosynthesis